MYLPFGLSTPILIGGLISHFATRRCLSEEATEKRLHKGILFGSGVIAGEALMGVGIAAMAAAGLARMDLGLAPTAVLGISVAASLLAVGLFVKVTRPER